MNHLTAPLAIALLVAGAAHATPSPQLTVAWKQAGGFDWPPVAGGKQRMVLCVRSGASISCHAARDGKRRWQKGLPEAQGLAIHGDRLFVLGRSVVYALGIAGGGVLDRRASPGARSLAVFGASLYLVDTAGIHRLEPATLRARRSAKIAGKPALLAADGDVMLVRIGHRLRIVDLRTKKQRYEFRLLRLGQAELVRFDRRRLAFLDRSPNKGLLFYTDVLWAEGKKTVDLTLSKLDRAGVNGQRFAAALSPSASSSTPGQLYLARIGGSRPQVLALDLAAKRPLWRRRDLRPTGLYRLTLPRGRSALLVAHRPREGVDQLLLLDSSSGVTLSRLTLDGALAGAPVVGAGCLLVQTTRSLSCVRDRRRAAVSSPPVSSPPVSSPPVSSPPVSSPPASSWPVYDDQRLGYRLALAPRWHQIASHRKRVGPKRWAIPFVRYRRAGQRWTIEGSIHLLVREAAGQDTAGLWRSVLRFRRQQDPGMRLLDAKRVRLAGGRTAILGRYTMRGRTSRLAEQWRSLVLVNGGHAFELRAWVLPREATRLWPLVERMMRSFRPR